MNVPTAQSGAQLQAIPALCDAFASWEFPDETPAPIAPISLPSTDKTCRSIIVQKHILKQTKLQHPIPPHLTPRVPNKPAPFEPVLRFLNTTPLTGATSKGAPQRDCHISSAHCTLHQVPHTNCTITSCSAHEVPVTTRPHGHAFPRFLVIFTQGPTSPLVHSCYSPSHSGPKFWDRGVPWIPPAPALSQIPKYLGRIILQLTRTYLPRHWDRKQRNQETMVRGNWNVLGHSILRCTCRKKKRDNLHESSVWGTPPKGRPQQDLNLHWWHHTYLPRRCSNPHLFPRNY